MDNLKIEHDLKVINLFGAPGVGKSTIAAGLFYLMKARGYSVEHITEYAKYLVLTKRDNQLKNEQLYLFTKQHHKQHILRGEYEWGITDSPLMLCAYYAPRVTTPSLFYPMVKQYTETFTNINVFLTRNLENNTTTFEEKGRLHNREQSAEIQQQQMAFLNDLEIPYRTLAIGGEDTAERLLKLVIEIQNNNL